MTIYFREKPNPTSELDALSGPAIRKPFLPMKSIKTGALVLVPAMLVTATIGCRKAGKSLTLPAKPSLPYLYLQKDYDRDIEIYKANAEATGADSESKAKFARNNIGWGLMAIVDELYNKYSANLFSGKGAIAVTGDAASLGLTSAVAIASKTAAKTLFGALGTAVTGMNLSLDKNLFAQQTYQVIALAMETRRTALFNVISDGLAQKSVMEYPLSAVKRDLVLYLYAGSLPGGLQEIQREAGAASADTNAKTPQPAGAPRQQPGRPNKNQPMGPKP